MLGRSLPELNKMGALQLAFFRQLCKLRRSVSASVIFAELGRGPVVACLVDSSPWLYA